MWSVRTRTTKYGVSSIAMEKRRTRNADMGSTLHSVPLLRDVQPDQKCTGLRPEQQTASTANDTLKLGTATLATRCSNETCSTRTCCTPRNRTIARLSAWRAQLAGSARAMSPRTTARSAASKAISSSRELCWPTTRDEVDEHSYYARSAAAGSQPSS